MSLRYGVPLRSVVLAIDRRFRRGRETHDSQALGQRIQEHAKEAEEEVRSFSHESPEVRFHLLQVIVIPPGISGPDTVRGGQVEADFPAKILEVVKLH